jgi:hypothetical protein
MSKTFRQELPQHVTDQGAQVLIPTIPWSMYRNVDNEPQPVTAREPISSTLYINTVDLPAGSDRTNFVISNNVNYLNNVARISPVSATIFNWFIPNINQRNNTLTIFSGQSGLQHTVTIPEGRYTDGDDIMDAIVTALNAISGSTLITFSYAATDPLFPLLYDLDADGIKEYYIVNTCTAVTHGYSMFAMDAAQTLANSHRVGPMPMQYTEWVDICSTVLTKYAKLRSVTSSSRSHIFARMLIRGDSSNPEEPDVVWGFAYDGFVNEDAHFSFRPLENVTSIDIQLRDQFGDLLYVPAYLADHFHLALILRPEM